VLRLSHQEHAFALCLSYARLTVEVDGGNVKGFGNVRLPNGALRRVELHWYEAHGIGRRDLRIKGYLEEQ